ncbi:TPA: DUF4156 domain-containing protein [Legionella pneumophila]|nr:DUF4156 domain-containing protein [Legionella pneumophila]HAT2067362.1 DUF4156 domain-containing protein [Legionella pneumophila]HAT8593510.1 DUF4156 domain-containing protein [Legionella pneumophila]HAU1577582.1 DUF4156 domain-containing protein [Legionella pneumophila]HAU1681784.1 DUF4156 domain-containing protein [Legionella pneumophila]HAU3701280.1 DUF4156 domain-containing protein [Legionella pneumophila]
MTHCLMQHALQLIISILREGGSYHAQLTPEGEKVTFLHSGKLPKSCTFWGEVRAYVRNGMRQPYQSHEHLIKDKLNILRNKAALLGANAVLVAEHQKTYEGHPQKNDFVTEHWMLGRAYQCMIKQ